MSKKYTPIAMMGAGFAGKDSAIKAIRSILETYQIPVTRHSLADELKLLADPYFKSTFGISAYTTNKEEKCLIRPLLVDIGRIKREQSQGRFWSSLLEPKIKESIENSEQVILSDLRFDDERFQMDEYYWWKNTFNGITVYIDRIDLNGRLIGPANEEEAKFNPRLKGKSNFQLKWVTTDDFERQKEFVSIQLKHLLDSIINT